MLLKVSSKKGEEVKQHSEKSQYTHKWQNKINLKNLSCDRDVYMGQ